MILAIVPILFLALISFCFISVGSWCGFFRIFSSFYRQSLSLSPSALSLAFCIFVCRNEWQKRWYHHISIVSGDETILETRARSSLARVCERGLYASWHWQKYNNSTRLCSMFRWWIREEKIPRTQPSTSTIHSTHSLAAKFKIQQKTQTRCQRRILLLCKFNTCWRDYWLVYCAELCDVRVHAPHTFAARYCCCWIYIYINTYICRPTLLIRW